MSYLSGQYLMEIFATIDAQNLRQAFLSHFPHAVPSTVLRDLRRAFHRNEGGEKWTTASPVAPTSRTARASPDPAPPPPPPTPSPMRLVMPDVGMPSPLCGYHDDWMGRDGESVGIIERDTERMVRCPLTVITFIIVEAAFDPRYSCLYTSC